MHLYSFELVCWQRRAIGSGWLLFAANDPTDSIRTADIVAAAGVVVISAYASRMPSNNTTVLASCSLRLQAIVRAGLGYEPMLASLADASLAQ